MGAAQASEKSILIVEDDSATREALAMVLHEEGYEVTGAANGEEALHQLRSMPRPCLILLDLMMPVMDGWQFRTEQKQDAALVSIPVVILSADGHVQQKAAALGVAGYLQKPVELDRLIATIERYC